MRTTFDRLDSDGCMSTNDTVLLLASGASGQRPDLAEFTALLTAACDDLAHQLLLDAEGATKAITIEVAGAASEDDAVCRRPRRRPVNLLKCAFAARTRTGAGCWPRSARPARPSTPDELNVAINGVWVCRNGAPGDDRSAVDLRPRDVTMTVDLSAGQAAATVLTTDLTAAYVHENSAYST